MKASFKNFQLLADKELYEAMVEQYGTEPYRDTGKVSIKTNNSFASRMIADKVGDRYKITPITSQYNERISLQMEAYWTVLKEFPIKEFSNVPTFYKQWFVNRGLMESNIDERYKTGDSVMTIKLMDILSEQTTTGMNPEDLEECDLYPLPEWWFDENVELKPKSVNELEFGDKGDFQSYASKHDIRDTTKVKIGGTETTAGAAKKDDVTGDVKKKKVVSPSAPNPYFKKKYGKLNLNSYPPMGVDEKDVKVNMEGNINSHAVMQWKDPRSGRTVSAYTPKFMAKNAKIKWARVQKIKPEYVDRIFGKSIKALRSRNPVERDAAAIIAIISKTGLRPGSAKGFEDTGNRGVSTLGPENIKIDGDKITINFTGKSYQENNAEFTDPELAKFLTKRIQDKKGKNFLFDANAGQVRRVFQTKLGRKGMKVKDLRTYTATKMAANVLQNNDLPPKPVPEKTSEIKKVVKKKLDDVFNKVSQKLNNTPAMAKSSYVHPKVIEKWLAEMGIEPALAK